MTKSHLAWVRAWLLAACLVAVCCTPAFAAPHVSLSLAAAPNPVASGGAVALAANATDSLGHSITGYVWSDGGVGGSFSPSAVIRNPTYLAPANTTDTDAVVALTCTVTCSGAQAPLGQRRKSLNLTVQPAVHSFSVSAAATPSAVDSGGSTGLSATATDSHPSHSVTSWSWDDGGAGGSFSPSAAVQNPSYTAPVTWVRVTAASR